MELYPFLKSGELSVDVGQYFVAVVFGALLIYVPLLGGHCNSLSYGVLDSFAGRVC